MGHIRTIWPHMAPFTNNAHHTLFIQTPPSNCENLVVNFFMLYIGPQNLKTYVQCIS